MNIKHLLSTFFPIPKYITLGAVGFDISDQSIRFVELFPTSNGIRLGRFGERTIPEGVLQNGKIADTKRFQEVLQEIKKFYSFNFIRASLPEEQVYLFTLRVPHVPFKEIRQSVEFQLEDHIPINAPDAVFDFEILSEDKDNYELQVSAVPEAIVTTYASMLKGAGLTPVSLELEAQAIARAIVKPDDMSTYMIVDFGNTRTGVSFVSRGVVMFASTIDVGGLLQTTMIAKNFNIPIEEAEKLKREKGLMRSNENKELFSVLLNSVAILRDEINKHFIFWHSHKDDTGAPHPNVEKILICGGNANLIGLADYLSMSLKVTVVHADVWVNVTDRSNYIPSLSQEISMSYATAIGLALGDIHYD